MEKPICTCGREMILVRSINSDELKDYKEWICKERECLIQLGSKLYNKKYGTYTI